MTLDLAGKGRVEREQGGGLAERQVRGDRSDEASGGGEAVHAGRVSMARAELVLDLGDVATRVRSGALGTAGLAHAA